MRSKKSPKRRDMDLWVQAYDGDQAVEKWMEDNPPPEDWHGTPMQWAWTEMPAGIFTKKPGRFF